MRTRRLFLITTGAANRCIRRAGAVTEWQGEQARTTTANLVVSTYRCRSTAIRRKKCKGMWCKDLAPQHRASADVKSVALEHVERLCQKGAELQTVIETAQGSCRHARTMITRIARSCATSRRARRQSAPGPEKPCSESARPDDGWAISGCSPRRILVVFASSTKLPPGEPGNDRRDYQPLKQRRQANSENRYDRHQVGVPPA